MTEITDPYRDLEITTRFQSRVCPEDHLFLKRILLGRSTMQGVINTMLRNLVQNAKANGFTDYGDQSSFIDWFNATYTTMPRLPADRASVKTAGSDVRRGAPGTRKKAPGEPVKPANIPVKPRSGPPQRGPLGGATLATSQGRGPTQGT